MRLQGFSAAIFFTFAFALLLTPSVKGAENLSCTATLPLQSCGLGQPKDLQLHYSIDINGTTFAMLKETSGCGKPTETVPIQGPVRDLGEQNGIRTLQLVQDPPEPMRRRNVYILRFTPTENEFVRYVPVNGVMIAYRAPLQCRW